MSVSVDEPKAMAARVLVVDANGRMRDLLIHALQGCGWQTEGAADGWEALTRLTEGQFTVVVTDIHMPGMDGLALLRAIRSLERPMPVVVQTTPLQPTLKGLLNRAGAFRVVMKRGPSPNSSGRWQRLRRSPCLPRRKGRGCREEKVPRQQNPWVNSGSGTLPSV